MWYTHTDIHTHTHTHTHNLSELINKFSNVSGQKIIIILDMILYTKEKKSEMEIKEKIPITIA